MTAWETDDLHAAQDEHLDEIIDYEADADEAPEDWDDDDGLTDAEADAMTLASAGWGTDEDYGYYGEDEGW